MGYEKPSTKLTFYKVFFSAQWKFLIHTIVQCMSAKRTAWNEFSSSMASALICLATGRKFNFSKYIFDSMVRNVDSLSKFLIQPQVQDATEVEEDEVDEVSAAPTPPSPTPATTSPSPTPATTSPPPQQEYPFTSTSSTCTTIITTTTIIYLTC
nr:glutamic acid-rich protein-like [Tanacetum cinerariifolium]